FRCLNCSAASITSSSRSQNRRTSPVVKSHTARALWSSIQSLINCSRPLFGLCKILLLLKCGARLSADFAERSTYTHFFHRLLQRLRVDRILRHLRRLKNLYRIQEAITSCHESQHVVVEGQLGDIVDGIAADRNGIGLV